MSEDRPRPAAPARKGAAAAPPPWLPLLPTAWRRPGGLPPPDAVWDYVRDWTETARRRLDELEGYLLAAAGEPAYAALAPGAAVAELERVRRWLEEAARARDLDAFGRVLQAHPGVLAAYERLERWGQLLRGPDHPRLIMAYRYLTDPDLALPEGEPFGELRELRAALLDMLSDPSVVLDEEGRRRFHDGAAAFRLRYKALYVHEHDRRRRPEALAPYRQLRDGVAFRTLRRLRAVRGAPVRAGLAEMEARLQAILATQCPGVDEAVLEARPVCTCGFRLDAPPPEPVDVLESALEREVWHGVRLLADPEVRRRLEAYVEGDRSRGSGAAAEGLARILGWVEAYGDGHGGADALGELEGLLTDEVIAALNEGLRQPPGVVVPRSLEALWERLADRDLSWEDLQREVLEWAFDGDVPPPGVLVRPLWGGGGERTPADGRARVRSRAAAGDGTPADAFPRTFSGWEDHYRRRVQAGEGATPREQEAFRLFYRLAVRGEGGGPAEGAVSLSLFEPAYDDGLLAGLRRPITLPLLLERAGARCSPWGRRLGLVWVDALRCDVWDRFLDRYGPGLEVLETGMLWVFPPATTAGQMARLDGHGIRFTLRRAPRPAPDPRARDGVPPWPSTLSVDDGASGQRAIVYVGGVEEALGEGAAPDELSHVLARELLPLLAAEPSTDWLVFGDHGFAEQGGGARGRRGEGPAYRQGGDSMEEVLVPWAALRAGGSGAGEGRD